VVDDDDQVSSSADLGAPDAGLAGQLGDFPAEAGPIDAAGHRVVHGGGRFSAATLVDEAMIVSLREISDLAPLHNPPALAAIEAVRALLPEVPSVACFDTGFHASLAPEAHAYAIPSDWVQRWGLRRYGFHGLSCAWATRRVAELLAPAPSRLIIAHLGGGASVTAVQGGRSTDTTMGFTPLEGLVMATRSGDIDPGALLWVLGRGASAEEVQNALEHRSGLLGLSGGASSDMRRLLAGRASGDPAAGRAIAVYLHRLRAKVAAMAAATEGTDALIFTAGVGERSATIRAETCSGLAWMGIVIDPDANAGVGDDDVDISAPGAAVRTLVIHAREELQMAGECRRLLQVRADDPSD